MFWTYGSRGARRSVAGNPSEARLRNCARGRAVRGVPDCPRFEPRRRPRSASSPLFPSTHPPAGERRPCRSPGKSARARGGEYRVRYRGSTREAKRRCQSLAPRVGTSLALAAARRGVEGDETDGGIGGRSSTGDDGGDVVTGIGYGAGDGLVEGSRRWSVSQEERGLRRTNGDVRRRFRDSWKSRGTRAREIFL